MAKAKRFRIPLIRMHNVMGIGEEVELMPGTLTLISGKNGLGKTSLVKGVLAALGRGNPANLLREGETEGQVVIVLDDGQGEPHLHVTANVTAKGVEREVGYPNTPPLARTQEVLAGIRNEFSLFPTSFLTDNKEKRLATFLNAIPLSVDRTDLAPLLKFIIKPDTFNSNRHAFVVLNELEKMLFEKRHDVNAVVTDKRKTVKTLEAGLPKEALDGEAANHELSLLRATAQQFRDVVAQQKEETEQHYRLMVDAAKRAYDDAVADAAGVRTEQLDKINEHLIKGNNEMAGKIATAEANASLYTQTLATREMIANMGNEADLKEEESKALTNALDVDLADIRSALLEQVPIEGVSVVDGDIYVKNAQGQPIPFDSVNTRERIRVCVDLALLKAGPLQFILLDGAEALDSDSLDQLQDILEARGAQCLASRVTDQDVMDIGVRK